MKRKWPVHWYGTNLTSVDGFFTLHYDHTLNSAGSSVDTTASLLTSRSMGKVSTNVLDNIKYSLDPDAPKDSANVHAEIVVALQ